MYKVTTILQGGLGNKMSEIAAAYSYSLKHGHELELYEQLYHPNHHPGIESYKTNIFSKLPFGVVTDEFIQHSEPSFMFSEIPKIEENLMLYGYFQSEKYFKEYEKEVRELFQFNSSVSEKYKHLFKQPVCSIHVRRGDYTNLHDYHPIPSMEYYDEAMYNFSVLTIYLVFSDDIEWCKKNFKGNFVFVEGNTDYEDLFLMQKCSSNIIANSSFSWWGAWLNESPDKKVVCPKRWFTEEYGYKISGGRTDYTKDLIPEAWIQI